MKLYQLKAEGENGFFGTKGVLYSGRLFTFRSRAIAFEPEFRRKCTTPVGGIDFACLNPDSPITFKVLELEVSVWEILRGLVGI